MKPKLKRTEVERIFCILCINTFGIADANDPKQHYPWNGIGVGLYLDVSRFNRSCTPNLYVQFESNRLVVLKLNSDDPIDKLSEKEFNRLTISYGVPKSHSFGSYIPLAKQRIDSLRSRYYFTRTCSLCSDQAMDALEERAAVFECPSCNVPYVWRRSSAKLRQLCPCKVGVASNLKEAMKAEKAGIKKLDNEWETVMKDASQESDSNAIIAACLPLWVLAKKYWHPISNLRFGQLSERLFHSFALVLKDEDAKGAVENRSVDVAIATDEAVLKSYANRSCDTSHVGFLYCQLAYFYCLIKGEERTKKAFGLYTEAAKIFNDNNLEQYRLCAINWRSQLGDAKELVQQEDSSQMM